MFYGVNDDLENPVIVESESILELIENEDIIAIFKNEASA